MKCPVFYCANFESGGEFRLAFEYINSYFDNYIVISRFHIFSVKNSVIFRRTKRKKIILNEYLQQFIESLYYGFYCAKLGYISGYINYCPLWNPFLWLFIEKKSIIGPVSGQPYNINLDSFNLKNLFGVFFLPALNIISILLIKFRKLNVCAANYYVHHKLCSHSIINHDFFIDFKDSLSKKLTNYNNCNHYNFDVVIYEHPHLTKNVLQLFDILYELKLNIKIATFGYKIEHPLVRQSFGYLNIDDLYCLLRSSKYYLTLSDEVGGIAAVDAAHCGCICICKKNSGASRYINNAIILDELFYKKSLINFLKNEYT